MGLATALHSLVRELGLLSQILQRKRKMLFTFFLAIKTNHRTTSVSQGLSINSKRTVESAEQFVPAGQILQFPSSVEQFILALQVKFLDKEIGAFSIVDTTYQPATGIWKLLANILSKLSGLL